MTKIIQGKNSENKDYMIKAMKLDGESEIVFAPHRYRTVYGGIEWLEIAKESQDIDASLIHDSRFSNKITLVNLAPKVLHRGDVNLTGTNDREKFQYIVANCAAVMIFFGGYTNDEGAEVKYITKSRYFYQYETEISNGSTAIRDGFIDYSYEAQNIYTTIF